MLFCKQFVTFHAKNTQKIGITRHINRSTFSSVSNIEIERKFTITEKIQQNIEKKAKFISQKEYTDLYYDNEENNKYPLTKNDLWLRQRKGIWEMKIPIYLYEKIIQNKNSIETTTELKSKSEMRTVTDKYKELENISEIISFLEKTNLISNSNSIKLNENNRENFSELLKNNNYKQILQIITNRKSFEYKGLNIVLDICSPIAYSIGEVEMMVENVEMIPHAQSMISELSKELEIPLLYPPPYGKVLFYIKTSRPDHYRVLEESGLIQSKIFGDPLHNNII